jgi:hypothetical protein
MFEILNLKIENKLINYLNSRFGIDKAIFNNYSFFKNGKKVFILSKQNKIDILKILNLENLETIGLELFANYKEYLLSSLAFTMFDSKTICENYIILNREQTKKYFRSEKILFEDISLKNKKILSYGNIVGIYNNKIIGILEYTKNKEFISNNIIRNLDVK